MWCKLSTVSSYFTMHKITEIIKFFEISLKREWRMIKKYLTKDIKREYTKDNYISSAEKRRKENSPPNPSLDSNSKIFSSERYIWKADVISSI